MKFLYDLLPVILFFVAYKIYDIFTATAVAIAVTLLQVFYDYFKNKKIDKMLLFNGATITILGGLTIIFQDKTFIMWKPSVLYWLFAGILFISNSFFDKNLITLAMGKKIELKKVRYLQENLILKYMLVMDSITKQQKFFLKLMKFKNSILVILLLESLFFLVYQKSLEVLKKL